MSFKGPYPGQQTKFFERTERIVFYGGAGGGGKSQCLVGKYGQILFVEKERLERREIARSAAWGLYLRRNTTDLKQSIDMAYELFSDIDPDVDFNKNAHLFTFPNFGDAKFEFGHMEHERSKYKYKSNAFCVAKGTGVVMDDGRTVPIECVEVGMEVMTLEGPRLVTATHRPGRQPCVRVTTSYQGATVGIQVHPTTHPVLLSPIFGLQPSPWLGIPPGWLRGRPHGLVWQDFESHIDGRSESPVRRASQVVSGNCFLTSAGERLELGLLPRWNAPVALHGPSVRRALNAADSAKEYHGAESSPQPSVGRYQALRQRQDVSAQGLWPTRAASQSAQAGSMAPLVFGGETGGLTGQERQSDSPGSYLASVGSHGGQFLHGQEIDPVRARLLADAEAHGSRDCSQDSRGRIPRDMGRRPRSYPHFYAGTPRECSEEVLHGESQIEWHGYEETFDLTVEGANHYITVCGIVNANCYIAFDELTEFTQSQFEYMDTRLRTTDPVLEQRMQICAGSNPDGEGLLWVRDMFIDGKEPETVYRIETKTSNGKIINYDSIFIPARLKDNPALYESGQYEASLMNKRPEVREAILEGNWWISPGAFLANSWDSKVHVAPNHDIPRNVTIARSGDFGILNPSSVTWWYIDRDGAFTAFHNLYVKGHTAEMLADRIHEIEEHYGYWDETNNCSKLIGPLDEDCFNQPNTSGPTIAGAMRKRGVRWRRSRKDRFNGAAEIVGRLTSRIPGATDDEPERPMIRWMERCIAPIKTLPVLRVDPNDPNDVDTKGEDHCYDDTMYMCLWRPMKPRDEKEDDYDDEDDKVVDLSSRRKYANSGMLGIPTGGWGS